MRLRKRLELELPSPARLLALAAFPLCLLAAGTPRAQASIPQSAASQAAAAQQPSLTVDRDPVASPDGDAAAPQAGSGASGQMTKGANGRFTLTQDVDEVVLNATVLDSGGHLVQSLQKSDFQVFEDGVPQTIASFRHEDVPVSIGILIDNSGSMSEKRMAVNQAAIDMVKASNADDETFIVNFSEEAYIDQDFTNSIDKLNQGLAHIDSKGGTALYDAVVASADYMAKYAKRAKQVLLIITDGEDNASSATLEYTIRRVQDLSGPVVYSIGLLFGDEDSPRTQRAAKRALQNLSDQTGGIAYFPKRLQNVDEVANEVAYDIRNQYTIGYHSTNPASKGGYRQIHVDAKAKGAGRLTVRTRAGYFPRAEHAQKPGLVAPGSPQ